MKVGRSLQEVLMELQRQNQAKKDYIAPAQSMRLEKDGRTFQMGEQAPFATTQLFHRQLASTLAIPAKYYDLMQKEKPELLAENVNVWLDTRQSNYMIRSMDYGAGPVARALLSERYRRIDNMEIASAVLPLFAGNDGYSVESCEVTENRLYLKILNLANAIIISAAKDYRVALRRQMRHPDGQETKHTVDRLENFFRSAWFGVLTDVDGEYLMARIRKEVEAA